MVLVEPNSGKTQHHLEGLSLELAQWEVAAVSLMEWLLQVGLFLDSPLKMRLMLQNQVKLVPGKCLELKNPMREVLHLARQASLEQLEQGLIKHLEVLLESGLRQTIHMPISTLT